MVGKNNIKPRFPNRWVRMLFKNGGGKHCRRDNRDEITDVKEYKMWNKFKRIKHLIWETAARTSIAIEKAPNGIK
jgi:hypothetical protein